MGNLEQWLLLRSLKTYTLRIHRQSSTAQQLAHWLSSDSEPCLQVIHKVWHTSLKGCKGHEAALKQGEGWTGVISIELHSPLFAKHLPRHLEFFRHATSLGGVESLIEWRYLSDQKVPPTLCRLSIGLEAFEDLKEDLRKGFEALLKTV